MSCTWKEVIPSRAQAGDWWAEEQLCWKGPGDGGRQQAKWEPVVGPGREGGQQSPGLHQQKYSQ